MEFNPLQSNYYLSIRTFMFAEHAGHGPRKDNLCSVYVSVLPITNSAKVLVATKVTGMPSSSVAVISHGDELCSIHRQERSERYRDNL